MARLHGPAALFGVLAVLALAAPATAQQQQQPKQQQSSSAQQQNQGDPQRPYTQRDVSAGDVAMTPLSDLNIRKGHIPPLLIAAQARPYDLSGIRTCGQIAASVGELDAVLGEDIDVAQSRSQRTSAGRVAQAAVANFIPFRGIIRELSGANAQDRKVQAAIYAGSARRAFLKGVGQQRGCRYPARSATAAMLEGTGGETAAPARHARRSRRR
jgi:hypothetical protein